MKSDLPQNHSCISATVTGIVGSKFGVGSQFGEKLLAWVGSVTPNWALTTILRAIVDTLNPITTGSAVYTSNWLIALM